MRKLVAGSLLGMWMVGLAAPAFATDDNAIPAGIEKFNRGVVNVAVGIPDEIIAHTVGGATYGDETLGGTVVSTLSGVFIGVCYGVARVGSGIVDIFTFPFDFNDNRPIIEPDHHV
jgi:putative exosortase-associated protein (TIGR04073 family)